MSDKTSQELRNDFNAAQQKINVIETRISNKLIKLATTHPDAVVDEFQNTKVKAKFIVDFPHIARMYSVEKKLGYIESIEQWVKEQSPIKQLNLFE